MAVLRQNSRAIIHISVARPENKVRVIPLSNARIGALRDYSAGGYLMRNLHVPAQFIPEYIRRKEAALQRPIRRERSRLGVDTRVDYPVDCGRCLGKVQKPDTFSSPSRHTAASTGVLLAYSLLPSNVATHQQRQPAAACGLAAHQYIDDVYMSLIYLS